jgi:hypothetical protein
MQWLIDNKEWLFSGVGVFIFGVIISFFTRKNASNSQTQKSGDNSNNYQASGDINIGVKNDKR